MYQKAVTITVFYLHIPMELELNIRSNLWGNQSLLYEYMASVLILRKVLRERPLMIWGGGRRKSRKKKFGGPPPGKNLKIFLSQEKINLKRPSSGKNKSRKIFVRGKKIYYLFI